MYDTKGATYKVWRATWPALRLVLAWRPGELGLLPPDNTRSREELAWWRDNLYQHTRRIISDGIGGIPATLLGVLSLLAIPAIPLIDAARELPLLQQVSLLAAASLLFAYVLVVGISYAAYVALRALPPKHYAKLVLSGRGVTEVLQTMAWEVRAACELFERATSPLHSVFTEREVRAMSRDSSLVALAVGQIRADGRLLPLLQALRRDRLPHEVALQRLFALKLEAARLLGISPRRFCDYIVQYSPRRQAKRLAKFLSNWDYVLRAAQGSTLSATATSRVVSLLLENERVMDRVRIDIQFQKDLFRYSDLHDDLYTIASCASSSEATLAYAKGVSEVAKVALAADKGSIDYAAVERRLQFLHSQQRSRPGFEPHMCLTQLCRVLAEHPNLAGRLPSDDGIGNSTASLAHTQVSALDAISDGLSLKGDSPEPLALSETGLGNLEALRELEFSAETYFDWSRGRIAEQFSLVVADWLLSEPTALAPVIVTSGLSKTVRGSLKPGLTAAVKTTRAVRSDARIERPQIFLLSREYDDDVEAQDMVAELRGDPSHPNFVSPGNPRQVADMTRLCRVLLVLGLDTFIDLGPSNGVQVLHSPAASSQVDEYLTLLDESKVPYSVIFVAGGYKAHLTPLLLQHRLLQFHLQHVSLFRSTCRLISDGGIIDSPHCKSPTSHSASSEVIAPDVALPIRTDAFVDGAWIRSGG